MHTFPMLVIHWDAHSKPITCSHCLERSTLTLSFRFTFRVRIVYSFLFSSASYRRNKPGCHFLQINNICSINHDTESELTKQERQNGSTHTGNSERAPLNRRLIHLHPVSFTFFLLRKVEVCGYESSPGWHLLLRKSLISGDIKLSPKRQGSSPQR